jgi:lysozyme
VKKRNWSRRMNEAGLQLLRSFEGLSLEPYRCPAGWWTIGYGHTETTRPGQRITNELAEDLLRRDVKKFEEGVAELVTVPLNDNQFAALVCFAFNIGLVAFARSTLLRKLNAGEHSAVPKELVRWRKSRGIDLPGLLRRREAEAKLWGA